MNIQEQRMPGIGQQAPSFKGNTTKGMIHFPIDFSGRWVVLFNHICDFTPVCTSEYMILASMEEKFEKLNCQILGLSINSLPSHMAWIKTIKSSIDYQGLKNIESRFPLIDDSNTVISHKYGMICDDDDESKAIRTLFIIDPEGFIRAAMQYPKNVGRNFEEVHRILLGLQISDKLSVALPANWKVGDDVMIPMYQVISNEIEGRPLCCGSNESLINHNDINNVELDSRDIKSYEWFMNTVSLTEEDIEKEIF